MRLLNELKPEMDVLDNFDYHSEFKHNVESLNKIDIFRRDEVKRVIQLREREKDLYFKKDLGTKPDKISSCKFY